jgi:hypothetical protein
MRGHSAVSIMQVFVRIIKHSVGKIEKWSLNRNQPLILLQLNFVDQEYLWELRGFQ